MNLMHMQLSDQGVSRDRYNFILRTLIFITRSGRVLLLKGAQQKRLWGGKYNGVGGHVERGEDVLSAAYRELYEETGLRVNNLWLCGTVTIDTGPDTGILMLIYRGECLQGEPVASSEGFLEWVSFDQVADLPLVEDLNTLLPRLLKVNPGDPPLSAHYFFNEEGQLIIRFYDPTAFINPS
jgi:8-oxo-dGTP diphosphatase